MIKQSQERNFWEDKERAAEVNQEISDLKDEFETFKSLDKELKDLEEMEELADENMKK